MKIYLVRHGRTHWNDLGLAQGLKDVPLNEEGINSAKELAKDIKNLKIDKCISSPLSRAKDTAKILVNDKIDIIYDDNSHEFMVRCMLYGKYTEGKGERVKEAKKEAAYKMLDYLGLIQ